MVEVNPVVHMVGIPYVVAELAIVDYELVYSQVDFFFVALFFTVEIVNDELYVERRACAVAAKPYVGLGKNQGVYLYPALGQLVWCDVCCCLAGVYDCIVV